jgi:hypothetical protein
MNNVVVSLLSLVRSVAGFASLGVIRIPPLGKVLLCGNREDEFLSAFTADEDPRPEPVHLFPSLLKTFPASSLRSEYRFVDRLRTNVIGQQREVNKKPAAERTSKWIALARRTGQIQKRDQDS